MRGTFAGDCAGRGSPERSSVTLKVFDSRRPISLVDIGRCAAGIAAVVGTGWWLFADTYARHVGTASDTAAIRFAHFGSYQDYELWRDVIARFEETHPGMRVRQEYIVGLADQYNTKMRQQILVHRLPDVALVQPGPFRDVAGYFADLSELLAGPTGSGAALGEERTHGTVGRDSRIPAAELASTGLDAFRAGGVQRGLPVSGGSLLIYCNTRCFERAGRFRGRDIALPGEEWSMDDFRRTAKDLTCDFDGDGVLDQFGFWLPRWVYYLPFIWSFGADIVGASPPSSTSSSWHGRASGAASTPRQTARVSWLLRGAEAETAFELYQALALDDRACPRDDEVPQLFQDVGFLTGKVGMCVNGPWFQPFLDKTGLADSYFVAHIPRGPAGRVTRVTWDGVVMADGIPPVRRATAKDFIRFILSKPVQDGIARAGRALPALKVSVGAFVYPPGSVRRQRFVDALVYSRIQPPLPRFGEVDRAINRHLYRLLTEPPRLSPHSVLEQLAADPAIQRAFNGRGAHER